MMPVLVLQDCSRLKRVATQESSLIADASAVIAENDERERHLLASLDSVAIPCLCGFS